MISANKWELAAYFEKGLHFYALMAALRHKIYNPNNCLLRILRLGRLMLLRVILRFSSRNDMILITMLGIYQLSSLPLLLHP